LRLLALPFALWSSRLLSLRMGQPPRPRAF
jgi:hypothetical protein